MIVRAISRRYAAALFDVIGTRGDLDRAGRDLDAANRLIEGHAQLRHVLETPAVPPSKKRAILEQVFTDGELMPEVRRLLLLLADSDRLTLLTEIAQAFADRLMELRRVVPAEVVTAMPLDATARDAIASALGRATGAQVTLTERVDPEIVGGLVARVGSLVFDGSLTRQVERLREELTTDQVRS
jgi:F-type H+-transporting ATPase subunit delta